MKEKLINLKTAYTIEIIGINDLIFNSDSSETAITRMLIEKNCYSTFIKQLDKILNENESLSSSKKE
jgi:hypothetical protein